MDYDNTLRISKKSRKLVIWTFAIIAVALSLPFLIGMLFFAWSAYVFHTTKPDGRAILTHVFPFALADREYLYENSERVKWIQDDSGMGGGHVEEGGACAIIQLTESENIDELKAAIIQKFSADPYDEASSITKAEMAGRPNLSVCTFLKELPVHIDEFEILASSGYCEGVCQNDFQEYSAFYNRKLNQILIESLDYDGDHAIPLP